jgi:hypothetical protein
MAKRGTKRAQLTLEGATKPKLRKPRKREWTKQKEAIFLTTLAETCNVTLACEAAGLSTTSAYNRRRANAAFRAGWAEVLTAAYQRLELVMLDRALNGTEKIVVRKDGSEERMREYSDRTAITLLKMHRDGAMTAMEEPEEADIAEVRARLVEKLERLRERFDAEERE